MKSSTVGKRWSRCKVANRWNNDGTRSRWIAGCLFFASAMFSLAFAQPLPDRDTLLLLQFDGSVAPDYALGTPDVDTRATTTGPAGGLFGGGVDLAAGEQLTLVGDDGNFVPAEGTIEFWIRPSWPGDDPEKHRFFTCRMGDRKYININSLGHGRIGIAVAAGDGDQWKWRRADCDASGWKAGQWHHLAFAWGRGELHVYVDGQESSDVVTDAQMPSEKPQVLHILGGDAVIDAFRISKRMFSEENAKRSIADARQPPYTYVADLTPTPPEGVDLYERRRLGEIRIPILLGDTRYTKALSCRPGAKLSLQLDQEYKTLGAVAGVDALSAPGAKCSFEVWGDGKRLFDSGPRMAGQPPLEVSVPLSGVKELTLATDGDGKAAGRAWAVWGNAVLRRNLDREVIPATRKLKPAVIDMYCRQQSADDYTFEPPPGQPYLVASKYWEDDIDPARPPRAEQLRPKLKTFDKRVGSRPLSKNLAAQSKARVPVRVSSEPLKMFAVPGEYEPLNFVVYAIDDLEQVAVQVSDLRCGDHAVPAGQVDARLVLRGLMRDLYTLPPERSTVVSRFLLPLETVDIPAGTFREYHLIVHVPDSAEPGVYRGQVRLAPANRPVQELPVAVEVLPFHFRPLQAKAYGIYYRFPSLESDWSYIDNELADIRAHGCTTLKPNVGIEYEEVDGRIEPSLERLERMLALLDKHGFRGPLPVETGCIRAARLLDYDPVEDGSDAARRDRFFAVVKSGLEGMLKLFEEYPQFEPLPTHMDEVFGRDRLERYIRVTEAVRQIPSLRLYITLHNTPRPGVAEMMQQCDPYVDVRCYNGHALEDWVRAGHTFHDLRRELDQAGDEAWIYHNIRGAFFQPEWPRLVNGLYLWVSPLRVHVPWMYYSYSGNPLDATDGPRSRGADFAYAVPDPRDSSRLVSTRQWEAFREGIDDIRYLTTLESLIEEHAGTPRAGKAHAWLDALRQRITPVPANLESVEEESPILVLLSRKLDGPEYRRIRRQAAEHITRLSGE